MKAKILTPHKQTINGENITKDGWYDPAINNMRVLFISGAPVIAVNVETGDVGKITPNHSWNIHAFTYCPEFKIEL